MIGQEREHAPGLDQAPPAATTHHSDRDKTDPDPGHTVLQ